MFRPVIVRLIKGVQGCDVYIGSKWNKNGYNLLKSKWSNPFEDGDCTLGSIKKYKDYVRNSKELYTSIVSDLTGQVLGCWCKINSDSLCHGDALLELWEELVPCGETKDEEVLKNCSKHFLVLHKEQAEKPKSKKRKVELGSKQPRKRQVKILRSLKTHPDGIKHNKKLQPWPTVLGLLEEKIDPLHTIYVDEVGAGPLAGPLVLCGIYLGDVNPEKYPEIECMGIHDSKLLKVHERDALAQVLKSNSFHYYLNIFYS